MHKGMGSEIMSDANFANLGNLHKEVNYHIQLAHTGNYLYREISF